MIREQDFSIPAGGAISLDIRWTYCRLIALAGVLSTGGLIVEGNSGGARTTIKVGQALRLPLSLDDSGPLRMQTRLTLRNPYTTTMSGTLVVGVGDLTDERMPLDTSDTDTMSGQFFRQWSSQAGGGATFPQVQLWNSASSGRLVFVQAVRGGSSAVDVWSIMRTTFELPTLQSNGSNLDSSFAGSQAVLKSTNTVVVLTGLAGMGQGNIAANTDAIIVFPKPVLLRPGEGLCFQLGATASNLRTAWEWMERPT